jgi:hypothetical protein
VVSFDHGKEPLSSIRCRIPQKLPASQEPFCSTELIKSGVHLQHYLAYELPHFYHSHTADGSGTKQMKRLCISVKHIIWNNFCVMVLGHSIFCIMFGVSWLCIKVVILDHIL